jgi:hypothetical protein
MMTTHEKHTTHFHTLYISIYIISHLPIPTPLCDTATFTSGVSEKDEVDGSKRGLKP